MDEYQVVTGVLMDEQANTLSFAEICQAHHIPEDVLIDLLEHGLLGHTHQPAQSIDFDVYMVKRIQSARRLQGDLGVNTPGVVLVLELRDALESMRAEIEILRRHVGDLL